MDDAIAAVADLIRDRKALHGQSSYVLIDPTLADLSESLQIPRDSRIHLPIDSTLISQAHCPYLVQLGEMGRDPVVEASVRFAFSETTRSPELTPGARTICAWIVSGEEPSKLVVQLSRKASVVMDGERRLFRFWDPRVMDLLGPFMSPEELGHLLKPVVNWCWMSRTGHVKNARHILGADQPYITAPATSLNGERFRHFGCLNCLLDLLDSMDHDVADEAIVRLDERIRSGSRSWDLQSEYERVSYAMYCVLVCFDFDSDERVIDRMRRAVQDGRSPIEALEALDEDFWSSVKTAQRPAGFKYGSSI